MKKFEYKILDADKIEPDLTKSDFPHINYEISMAKMVGSSLRLIHIHSTELNTFLKENLNEKTFNNCSSRFVVSILQ